MADAINFGGLLMGLMYFGAALVGIVLVIYVFMYVVKRIMGMQHGGNDQHATPMEYHD